MGDKGKLRSVPADPSKWSAKSRLSLSVHYVKEYTDHQYVCWRCKRNAVFSAADQKYTFEVKKAPIDQRRIHCTECWRRLLEIDRDIKLCQQQWAESKKSLRVNAGFLTHWLSLLVLREEFVPYRPDSAAQRMLRKLLDEANA
jgi:DNA-directed RNA polymerase subunit RPC12/RpoP